MQRTSQDNKTRLFTKRSMVEKGFVIHGGSVPNGPFGNLESCHYFNACNVGVIFTYRLTYQILIVSSFQETAPCGKDGRIKV